MPNVITIGGGKIERGETLPIDREILRLSGRRRPNVLFIPTASGDAADYCERFHALYAKKLGCPLETLLLYRNRPSKTAIRRHILSAEVIYVGGGNTLRMMKLWRRLGVDRFLATAARKETVLAGTSAGAICWMQWGCSDSRKFSGRADWQLIRVSGLGLLDLAGCPHYHSERREAAFDEMIRKHPAAGIALDDCAALEVAGDCYRLVTGKPTAGAWRVFKHNGRVHRDLIRPNTRYAPLSQLTDTRP